MNKLNTADIQFIDNYLSNSDIQYEDVRVELIDHVASEIENLINQGDDRGFYTIFKEYMVKNKASIEKQGSKPFNWKIFKGVFRKFFKNLYSWQVVSGSLLCFLIFKYIYKYFPIQNFTASFFPSLFMIVVMLIPLFVFGKKKFSFIGNFGVLVCIIISLNSQVAVHLEKEGTFFYVNLVIMSVLFATSLKTMISLVLFYRKRFQNI